jgi:ankyrin repeat protein
MSIQLPKMAETALMLAASSGDAEIVRVLLSVGAAVTGRYVRSAETALVLAKRNGNDDVVRLLEEAGAEE